MKKNIAIIENNIIATNTIRRKLTSALMEQGYNVVVLTTGKEAEIALARERGFNIIDVKSSNSNPLDILKYIRNIRRALKSSNRMYASLLPYDLRSGAIWLLQD